MKSRIVPAEEIDSVRGLRAEDYVDEERVDLTAEHSADAAAQPVSVRSLNGWIHLCHAIAKERGWWDTDKDVTESKLLLFHSEISEAVEEIRKGRALTEVYFHQDENGQMKPEGFPIEIADLFIRLADLSARHGIDLTKAVALKCDFNMTRPKRHGGKAF